MSYYVSVGEIHQAQSERLDFCVSNSFKKTLIWKQMRAPLRHSRASGGHGNSPIRDRARHGKCETTRSLSARRGARFLVLGNLAQRLL